MKIDSSQAGIFNVNLNDVLYNVRFNKIKDAKIHAYVDKARIIRITLNETGWKLKFKSLTNPESKCYTKKLEQFNVSMFDTFYAAKKALPKINKSKRR